MPKLNFAFIILIRGSSFSLHLFKKKKQYIHLQSIFLFSNNQIDVLRLGKWSKCDIVGL